MINSDVPIRRVALGMAQANWALENQYELLLSQQKEALKTVTKLLITARERGIDWPPK